MQARHVIPVILDRAKGSFGNQRRIFKVWTTELGDGHFPILELRLFDQLPGATHGENFVQLFLLGKIGGVYSLETTEKVSSVLNFGFIEIPGVVPQLVIKTV